MKILQSSIFRALCALVTGFLLVMYREEMVQWLTIAIGALFFISGVISCATYFSESRSVKKARAEAGGVSNIVMPAFPIVGIGSIVLGAVLALMPATFVAWLMYFLAAILILGAINQFTTLAAVRKFSRVPFVFWLFPSVILLIGIFMIVKPMEMSALPFRILGWCIMLYGVVECINGIKIYQCRKNLMAPQIHVEDMMDTEAAEAEEKRKTESLQN